jgi:structural maintenance of chromosome 2
MDGREIKVQLGSVWKQSLTELSRGQRYAQLIIIALTTVSYLSPTCMYQGRLSRYP